MAAAPLPSSLRPLAAAEFDYWKAQHLLNRAGFGGTPAQARALADLGLNKAIEYIINYETIEAEPVTADQFDGTIMRPPTQEEQQALAAARRQQDEAFVEQFRMERQRRQGADRRQHADVQAWWLKRMIQSPRPLEEKMTLFWHGHFATGYRTIENSYDMFQQNQFFRANATGNFAELVYGIIRDPAMLRYLNNNQNRRQAPNENLARELMELFVLGEGNAYTEVDIKEGARALTGYTYRYDESLGHHMPFFDQGQHDPTPKRILGKVGPWDGVDFCRIILQNHYASQFICWKFYRFFVNDLPGDPDQPTQQFILKLAELLRKSNYELKPVLTALFKSEHFYHESNRASLIKSPTQLIVQAVRSMYTPVRSLRALVGAGDLMGQDLLMPPSVKGWDGGRSWINTATLYVRQNLLVYLLTGRRPNTYEWEISSERYDATHLVANLPRESGRVRVEDAVPYLLRFILGADPPPERTRALLQFAQSHAGPLDNDMIVALLSLITAMPEYQLC
ncbi:MAG: DUF1800 domain-containing protein [Phycisphaerales bacterium]